MGVHQPVGRPGRDDRAHTRPILRDLLRDTDLADHDKFARRFDELTAEAVEPLYRATLWYDRHRLAEIDADIAGAPYRTEDMRWLTSKALFAASLADPDLTRAYSDVVSFDRHARRGARSARCTRPGHRARHGRRAVPAARSDPRRAARRDRLKRSVRER